MIGVGTHLDVMDNSGAKKVQCIKIVNGAYKRYGYVGDLVIVTVKTINPLKKIKKGEIYKGIIGSIKKKRQRLNGSYVNFDKNFVVIVNNKKLPIATRLLSPVMSEVRDYNFNKILSMATCSV